MKNKYSHTLIIKTITLFLFLASFCTVNSQTTYFLRNEGGNWNANTTWSTVSSSSSINAGTFPTTGDNVYFNGTGTVNLNITANAACANFYNQSLDGAFLNLNLSGSNLLTVSGVFEISASVSSSRTTTLTGTGTLAIGGNINVGTDGITPTVYRTNVMNFNGPNINVEGNVNLYNRVNGSIYMACSINHSNGTLSLKGKLNSYQNAPGLDSFNKYSITNIANIEFYFVGESPIFLENSQCAPVFNLTNWSGNATYYNNTEHPSTGSVVYGTTYNKLTIDNPNTNSISASTTVYDELNIRKGILALSTSDSSFGTNLTITPRSGFITKINISSPNGITNGTITGSRRRIRFNGLVDIKYSGDVKKAGIELITTNTIGDQFLINSIEISGTSGFSIGTLFGRSSSTTTNTELYVISSLITNDTNITFDCNINCPLFNINGNSTFTGNLTNVQNLIVNSPTIIEKSFNISNTLNLSADLTIGTTTPSEKTNINVPNVSVTSSSSIIQRSGTNKIISITNLLSINQGAILTSNESIRLVSNQYNTARVGIVNSGAITGKVIVERYLRNNGRKWRLLTAPVYGADNNSIFFNWQNNGDNTVIGKGTDIWGNSSTYDYDANGLIYLPNSSHNFRSYKNGTWSSVNNTKNNPSFNLFDSSKNNAFLAFIIYPAWEGIGYDEINESYTPVTDSGPTTLVATGKLLTGTQEYTINNSNYFLIGNPYASPISFENFFSNNSTTIAPKIWLLNPNENDVNSNGSYVTWDPANQYSDDEALVFSNGKIIQSGQGFFIKGLINNNDSSKFYIYESDKRDNTNNLIFNRNQISNTERIRVKLSKLQNDNYIHKDACVVGFYSGASNTVDQNDVQKFSNPAETLAFLNGTSSLSSEHRAPLVDGDELFLKLTSATVSNYKLKIYTENFAFSGSAYLHDLKLGTITPMPIDGSIFEYPFEVTSDATTQGTRFKIVFSTTLGIDDNNNPQNITAYPNPTSKSDGITVNLGKLDFGTYSYRIVNMLGQEIQKGELTNQEINQEFKINFKIALTSGVYSFEIFNQNKTIQTLKILLN